MAFLTAVQGANPIGPGFDSVKSSSVHTGCGVKEEVLVGEPLLSLAFGFKMPPCSSSFMLFKQQQFKKDSGLLPFVSTERVLGKCRLSGI